MCDQEYTRGGRESVLAIAVCKHVHPLPSTEVKLHNLTHKPTTNVWHIITTHLYLHALYSGLPNIASNDKSYI